MATISHENKDITDPQRINAYISKKQTGKCAFPVCFSFYTPMEFVPIQFNIAPAYNVDTCHTTGVRLICSPSQSRAML